MVENNNKEQIALIVMDLLSKQFTKYPDISTSNRNAPFQEGFLNTFSDRLNENTLTVQYFLSLASWSHGLSTAMGMSFFEKLAHIISGGAKKGFTVNEGTLLKITSQQKSAVNTIITRLKNGVDSPNLVNENLQIKDRINDPTEDSTSFTADVFFEQEDKVVAIELKSVRPNAGEMKGEKQKLLEAKAALSHEYQGKTIKYFMAFPFDPTSSTSTEYDKERFLDYLIDAKKYLHVDEILLGQEFWQYLSGDRDTMQDILTIINDIANPHFLDNLEYLNNSDNRTEDEENYKILLQKWCLFRELEIFEYNSIIKAKLGDDQIRDSKIKKHYIDHVLKIGAKGKIKYNKNRYEYLKKIIDES